MLFKDQRGFTLIEMTVAVTVLTLVMLTMVTLTFQSNLMWQKGKKEVDVQQSAAIALNKLARELRMCSGLIEIDSHWLKFAMTIKDDDKERNYEVTYMLYQDEDSGKSELRRQTQEVFAGGYYGNKSPPLPVASNIKAVTFKYYDLNGQQVAVGDQAAKVARVDIEILGGADGVNDHKLVTSVAVRNRL